MSITVDNKVVIEGEVLDKPTFTLSNNNSKSELTVSNQTTNKATINAEGNKNKINFVGTAAKSPTINGDTGKEIIKIKDDAQLTGRAKINLGENKDSVVIDGIINKLTIDNGDDNSKDTITINSIDLISKKLKIKNFGEKDKLVIEGQAFKYQSLEEKETRDALKELGIVVNLIDNN